MSADILSAAEIANLLKAEEKMTLGEWFYNSYCAVHARDLVAPHEAFVDELAEAGWPGFDKGDGSELAERDYALTPDVCRVPPHHGDTATGRHAADAEGIVALRNKAKAVCKSHEALRERLAKLDGNDEHPENRCQRCGGRNLHNWYADSDVWNALLRAEDGTDEFGVLCPICFGELAKERGTAPTAWRLSKDGDDPEVSKVMAQLHARRESEWRLYQEAEALRARVVELEGVLREIACHPHCRYITGTDYDTGVAHGHRRAAKLARAALYPTEGDAEKGEADV